ncbi:3-isopropylmalate dehydratase small subunit [Diaphorobacter aerolatus]|uniref:3-isopropylmalate dehydratase small subunit n=1 Tax=Diaphorobacter aerolatus TaxID=1288495 RepID=A0A7H0GL25_9BURK|nr:3-isopropylmalate dehydratase small subunit [Diaphorobacter aerolatus]QNP48991.1 3-isopropylmalate dehydratase small subunit [Diaphorobacter aerolatus]
MQSFTRHHGIVVPMDRANIDTDAILPKQFMKSVSRTGFGPYLFDGLRYLDPGELGTDLIHRRVNPDFVLNQPRYKGASILLARRNFGCGSSREHAPWAITQYGIRVLIAPSFADIFLENSFKNGLLAVTLDEELVDQLFNDVEAREGYALDVDLELQRITLPSQQIVPFHIAEARRQSLLQGLDEIGTTLQSAAQIRSFEARHRQAQPWLFNESNFGTPSDPNHDAPTDHA